eukprot:2530738-Prymnesium_polylepis.1
MAQQDKVAGSIFVRLEVRLRVRAATTRSEVHDKDHVRIEVRTPELRLHVESQPDPDAGRERASVRKARPFGICVWLVGPWAPAAWGLARWPVRCLPELRLSDGPEP